MVEEQKKLQLYNFAITNMYIHVRQLLKKTVQYRMSQKWRTSGALQCRRDYRKRQKNVKKILLDLHIC
jgi:hypothetical protein